jgi:phosphatidylinositol glycan class V
MGSWYNAVRQPHHAPLSSLVLLFIGWKLLLLTIAFSSPGLGYDTSTRILFQSRGLPLLDTHTPTAGERFAEKLVRWDAIYFTTIASQGYTFEQEWAFGWGVTRFLAFLTDCEFLSTVDTSPA